MTKQKAVALVWYCRTAKGWRRYPVVLAANNRIKLGYVLIDGVLTHCPDGRFEIRLYQGRKVIYKRAGTNAADAMAALDQQRHLVAARGSAEAAGVKIVEDPKRLPIRKAALAFEEDAKQRGAMEAAEMNRHVMDEFIAVCGRTYVDEISRDDVFRFHKALRERGCGDRTVSNKHMRLRSFLRFCKLDYSDILPPAPKFDARQPDTYTQDQRADILRVASPYMRLALEVGMMCGLREQEIMHLEWSDIHWSDAILRVTSKPHWGNTIKDSEARDIPIPKTLLKHLQERRKAHSDGSLVLPTAGGRPNGKLLRTLKRLAKANGLSCGVCKGCKGKNAECQRWTLHKLRRTFGTMLLREGLDLATVQAYLGHSDLASTMRYLQPATSAASQKAINAIKWT